MASVYKRKRKGVLDKKYTVAFINEHGKQVTRAGYTDKQKSLQLAAKLERECQLVRDGMT